MSSYNALEIGDAEESPRAFPSDVRTVRSASVADLAHDRLAHSSYPELRTIRCYFREGVLTLRGQVRSYHTRQVAWKLVCKLDGVEEFVDRIVVVDNFDRR
jgi:osmotically-inducible protein OsmY